MIFVIFEWTISIGCSNILLKNKMHFWTHSLWPHHTRWRQTFVSHCRSLSMNKIVVLFIPITINSIFSYMFLYKENRNIATEVRPFFCMQMRIKMHFNVLRAFNSPKKRNETKGSTALCITVSPWFVRCIQIIEYNSRLYLYIFLCYFWIHFIEFSRKIFATSTVFTRSH